MTTFWLLISALTVRPSKAQFSLYESLFLSCGGGKETSSEWTCRRNTTVHTNQACCENGASCYISNLYEADSGGYWCESAKGEHDGTVNITVTRFPVILESPVAPVTEGDSVTLACHLESTSTSPPGITADFYKDGILVWSSSSADVTLHTVSKANEGLYKCNISGQGESLESWLIVRERPVQLEGHLDRILLPVVSAGVALLVLMLLCCLKRQRDTGDPDLNYTDVTVTQEVETANRRRDANTEQTFYSDVKPGGN